MEKNTKQYIRKSERKAKKIYDKCKKHRTIPQKYGADNAQKHFWKENMPIHKMSYVKKR